MLCAVREAIVRQTEMGSAKMDTSRKAASPIRVSANNAARPEEAVTLAELARTQIELIQQAPYSTNPSDYPTAQNVPEPYSVTFTSTDPGTTYRDPVIGETASDVVQQIIVTASGESSSVAFTFYKIKPKGQSQ